MLAGLSYTLSSLGIHAERGRWAVKFLPSWPALMDAAAVLEGTATASLSRGPSSGLRAGRGFAWILLRTVADSSRAVLSRSILAVSTVILNQD